MRNKFDRELEELNRELMEMAFLIEQAIENAVGALLRRNVQEARQAIAFDSEVDAKERDIERRCLRLLLQQQPVATDLRVVSTALKMITDLERIGDQAADIAEICMTLSEIPGLELEMIPQMAQTTIGMVKDSIDAFVARDQKLAREVIDRDDLVDSLFVQVKHRLVTLIQQSSTQGEAIADMLMVAKYLERIGDHATNIAEWVEFAITGVHKNAQIL